MAKNYEISVYFSINAILALSRAAITWKFRLRWFPNEGPYKAGKLKTDIDLVPLMPDENKIFTGSLIWIREFDHVKCTPSTRNHPYFSFGCLLRRVFPVRFKTHPKLEIIEALAQLFFTRKAVQCRAFVFSPRSDQVKDSSLI